MADITSPSGTHCELSAAAIPDNWPMNVCPVKRIWGQHQSGHHKHHFILKQAWVYDEVESNVGKKCYDKTRDSTDISHVLYPPYGSL